MEYPTVNCVFGFCNVKPDSDPMKRIKNCRHSIKPKGNMVSCYRRSIHNFYLSSIIFWENDKELKHIENEYNDTSAGE